jgi:hypothetical protein
VARRRAASDRTVDGTPWRHFYRAYGADNEPRMLRLLSEPGPAKSRRAVASYGARPSPERQGTALALAVPLPIRIVADPAAHGRYFLLRVVAEAGRASYTCSIDAAGAGGREGPPCR